MKPVVSRELCVGCGTCEEHCPEVFRLDDSGLSYVLAKSPELELYGAVRDCAELCPAGAISVTG